MLKKLWNYTKRILKDQRGEIDWGGLIGGALGTGIGSFGGPGMAAIGGMIGGGIGSSVTGGGLSKGKTPEDPLAPIRQQLMGLATRSQELAARSREMVTRQKELIGQRIGEAERKGTESIGEGVYGERGFGRTSIYDRLKTELIDKLAKTQAESELQAEMGGLQAEMGGLDYEKGIYSTLMGYPSPAEEPSLLSKGLGYGAEILGQQYGLSRLENLFGGKTTPTTYTQEETPDFLAKYRKEPIFAGG